MDTWVWIVIAVVVVLVVLGLLWTATRKRRTAALRDQYGSEYDRAVDKEGGRRAGERELSEREKRHEELDLRPLSPEARRGYQQAWEETQGLFVDDPTGAVARADELVQRVMRDRGYPVDDFEQRAADISVEHPDLVEKYRTANGIARASERGEASTEDLRHSVRHFRALFVELIGRDGEDEVENVDAIASRDGDARGSDRDTTTADRGR